MSKKRGKPIVAVVGRPNVGKSTLFNALAGEMISIVKDTPGVTRDRIYADVTWLDKSFTLIDTGGIEPDSSDVILSQMRDQAQIAIDTADVILFMTDVRQGLQDADSKVADMLRRSHKPVILVVNKVDDFQKYMPDVYEFYNLGIGDPVAISAANRLGVGDMLDQVISHFPEDAGNEEEDESLIPEVQEEFEEFQKEFENLRITTMLTGEHDAENAILTLHAGAGGTESCDWASMLCRMYEKWADKRGFSVKVLDSLDGDEAGLKSVTLEIHGENAYGYLKSEHGVHRLVRISPFNAAGKRQTSFVSCDVMPDIEQDIDIEIAEDDIRIDTYRSSGAGGQHINKTSSAIRITHFPTGIVVQCQNERSQHMNKDKAMQMLKAKLLILREQENLAKESDIRGDVKEIGWGSQIRSYVMQPYTMVKDHRTNAETGNVSAVMDGDIDLFMNAYLKWINS